MTLSPPVCRSSTDSSTMKLNAIGGVRVNSSCCSMRAAIRSTTSASVGGGGTFSITARAYASVCNRPGATLHSYVQGLTAADSNCAHSRNHAARPRRRDTCWATARSTPNESSASSARSTKSPGGMRRPCSIEATHACE